MFEHPPPVSEVDVFESPDAVAAELATSVPRGDDVAALLMLEPEALSDAGRVDLLVGFERSIALLQAAQQQVLASLDGRALDWSGKKLIDYTREQVGAALRLSPGTAERRLSIARTLIDRLPATLDLLRRGLQQRDGPLERDQQIHPPRVGQRVGVEQHQCGDVFGAGQARSQFGGDGVGTFEHVHLGDGRRLLEHVYESIDSQ